MKKKKIVKLIIYIIAIFLIILVLCLQRCRPKKVNAAMEQPNWISLNNVLIHCVVNGALTGTLDADVYYYMNNGNDSTGQTSVPAFTIYDEYTGLEYDEIRIRRNSIILRGYRYDSITNEFTDYYDRAIWADDYISDSITPDKIKFDNITATSIDNVALFSSNFGQNGPVEFLNLINLNMTKVIEYADMMLLSINTRDNVGIVNIYALEANNKLIGYLLDYTVNNVAGSRYVYLPTPVSASVLIQEYDTLIDIALFTSSGIGYIYFSYYNGTTRTNIYIETNISFSYLEATSQDWYYSLHCVRDYIDGEAYRRGYILGNTNGYSTGYNSGYSAGYSAGESAGYDVGYTAGVVDGSQSNVSVNWITSILNTALGFLNLELFPGVKIIYLVGIFVILSFVKYVIGWLR